MPINKVYCCFLDEVGCVCVATLDDIGVSLIGHCIARCLVARRIPSKVIVDLDKEQSSMSARAPQEGRSNIFSSLYCMTKSLPESLTSDKLLLYCSFEAAFQWNDNKHKVVVVVHSFSCVIIVYVFPSTNYNFDVDVNIVFGCRMTPCCC